MKAWGIRKILSCLAVCLVAAVGGSASLYTGTTAFAGLSSATSVEGAQMPAKLIRPKKGFELQRVGNRYEPVVHYDETFRLPGTRMRFGPFKYFTPEDEELAVPKYGFLLDDGRFFYVDEYAASDSDPTYALIGNYFIVDGGVSDGACICRSMYLFTYDDHSARLIDKIEEQLWRVAPPGFMSDYPGKPAYGHEIGTEHDDVPVWVIVEKDVHGHPLIRLKMIRDLPPTALGPHEIEAFHLYLKIVNGKLRIALDPEIYEPLFDGVKDAGGPGPRSNEYYVSGFLAGKLSLARIKAELAGNEDREWLVDSLKHVRRWDAALHERYGHPLPRIIEYKLNGR